jgi:hypothetical protein
MSHETHDYLTDKGFLKHAASSCGVSAELHGKQEAWRPGAEITLELPQPFQASAFCRANLPPIVVKMTRLCILGDEGASTDEEGSSTDRVFTGKTIKSVHSTIQEGDTVIGLASPGCDVLVANADDPSVMGYLRGTYDDEDCMQCVTL